MGSGSGSLLLAAGMAVHPAPAVGDKVQRRDADDEWKFGYITQLEPLKVTSSAVDKFAEGFAWDSVRAWPSEAVLFQKAASKEQQTKNADAAKEKLEVQRMERRKAARLKAAERIERKIEAAKQDGPDKEVGEVSAAEVDGHCLCGICFPCCIGCWHWKADDDDTVSTFPDTRR